MDQDSQTHESLGGSGVQTEIVPALLRRVESCWATTATSLPQCNRDPAVAEVEARRIVEALVFLELCQRHGLDPRPTAAVFAGDQGWPDEDATILGAVGKDVLARISTSLREGLSMAGPHDPPPEVLGQIHQHLLSRRLQRRTQRDWRTTSTAQTRKASGVYYTPESIRNYVVERALGARSLDGPPGSPLPFDERSTSDEAGPAILDPTCGGGWFLLSASRRLLARPQKPDVVAVAGQLYGVDIDWQAVLVTRRALWLELALCDADRRVAVAQILADRIRCGDVLMTSVFDKADFDIVIGNPPYRRELGARTLMEHLAASPLGQKYRAPRMDLWYYFVHRSLELLRPGGRMSLVVGAYWTAGRGAEKLIRGLQQSSYIEEIASLDRDGLFPGVAGRQMILTVRNLPDTAPTVVKRLSSAASESTTLDRPPLGPWIVFEKRPAQLFRAGRIDLEPADDAFLARLERWTPLGQLGEVRQGIAENPATVTLRALQQYNGPWQAGEGVFTLHSDELACLQIPATEQTLLRPYYDLCDLGRYRIAAEPSRTLIYATRETCPAIDRFPTLLAHLERFRPILEARRETQRGSRAWWQLHWPREERLWRSPKLVVVQMAVRPAVVAARRPAYVPFSTNVFVPYSELGENLDYLSALLNSRVLWKWYRHHAKYRGVGIEINGHVLARTPIRRIDFSNPADAARHARLAQLSAAMTCESAPEIDAEIDALVGELYGVKAEEC